MYTMGNTQEVDAKAKCARYLPCRLTCQCRDITVSYGNISARRTGGVHRWLQTVGGFRSNSERPQYLFADHDVRKVDLDGNSVHRLIGQQTSIVPRDELCDDRRRV